MNVIIIGGGKVGRRLLEDFDREGHNVALVDTDAEVIERVQNDYDVMAICGSGTDVEVLDEAGVKHCDIAICVTDKDEMNALSAIIVKKLGAKSSVARIRNRRYFNQISFMRDELGINLIINPEFYAAKEISRNLQFPATIRMETFAKGRIELAELKLPLALNDLPVSDVYKKYKLKILICAVSRNDEVIIPNGDFILRSGDKIYITASHSELARFMKQMDLINFKIKTAMLVGGGRISYYLAKQLLEGGINVKIIEKDYKKCIQLSENLPKATIIHGDGTDQVLLDDEGIEDVDSFVSLTGIDEENIVISMYARMKGVDKVITKINRFSFANMLDTIGIESVVTPKDITANVISGYARAMMEAEHESEVVSLYRIVNNQAEAVEFKVTDDSEITDVPLKDLKLKKNILIAAIVGKDRKLLPDGNSTIEVGDTVIVVTTRRLTKLSDILA